MLYNSLWRFYEEIVHIYFCNDDNLDDGKRSRFVRAAYSEEL